MSLAAGALIVGCWAEDGDRADAVGVSASFASKAANAAPGTQLSSSVAFDGENFLVVWVDAPTFNDIFSFAGNIRGTRVSRAGLPLDPGGIPISSGETSGFPTATAFNGADYLVVWSSLAGITGSRVSTAGAVLTPDGIPIFTPPGTEFVGSVVAACGTADCLVVWDSFDVLTGNNDVHATRVSRSGAVLDPGGFDIAAGADFETLPAVAFDGTNYLVVWEAQGLETTDVRVARVSQGGAVLDPGGIFVGNGSGGKSVACGGPSCLVSWTAAAGAFGARVSNAGTVLDSPGFLIDAGPAGVSSSAFDGRSYLVVLEADQAILAKRVSQAGVVLDPEVITISTFGELFKSPAVAFGQTSYLVTWNDLRFRPFDHVFGARVNTAGAVLGPPNGRLLSTAEPSHP